MQASMIDPDLPDEIRALLSQESDAKQSKIDNLSLIISRKRQEAVDGRAASGIEDDWLEDEEAYQGIDDANRSAQKMIKPSSSSGGVTRAVAKNSNRSTVFLNITRPYVDAASARVSDMLLPTDDRAWSIKPTPAPELIAGKDSKDPLVQNGKPLIRAAKPGEVPPAEGATPPQPGQPDAPPPQVPMTAADLAQQHLDKAAECAKKAETRIDDWLVECNFHAEVRKVIEDCARLGTGILKGPFPDKSKGMAIKKSGGELALDIKIDIKPKSKRIKLEDAFPDPACGESIHDGGFFLERDYLTEKRLRDLIGVPGYLKDQILKCIEEGPQKKNIGSAKPERDTKSLYEIWYYYGAISAKDMEAAGGDLEGRKEDSIYAVVTMVNDRVIKAHVNPLDSGDFPYDFMPWQRRTDMPWGSGVARQTRTPQGMLNAATRNMLDNAALSGGPIIGIRKECVEPENGKWELAPRKIFQITEEADLKSAQDAIFAFNIPSMQQEMMNIIQFAQKMAEDVTGIPQLLQGQSGNAPDTVGGMQMLQNNASTVLRRIARTFDDHITEPHIRRYYEYLLLWGEDEEEKGDFTIDARGSSALVERDIQGQALLQMGGMVMNPAFGIDPKKWFAEIAKAQHLDPKRIQFSEEEMEKLAQQPPQPPLPIAVAQLKAQSDQALQTAKAQSDMALQQAESQAELQRIAQEAAQEQQMLQSGGTTPHMASATARIEQERIRAQTAQIVEASRAHAEEARADKEMLIAQQNGQFKLQELQLQKEIALLDYANREKVNLDTVKAQLAKAAMDNQTKRQLASAEIQLAAAEGEKNRVVDVHKHAASLVRDEMSTPETP